MTTPPTNKNPNIEKWFGVSKKDYPKNYSILLNTWKFTPTISIYKGEFIIDNDALCVEKIPIKQEYFLEYAQWLARRTKKEALKQHMAIKPKLCNNLQWKNRMPRLIKL